MSFYSRRKGAGRPAVAKARAGRSAQTKHRRAIEAWLRIYEPLEPRTLLSQVSLASYADSSFSSASLSAAGISTSAQVSLDGNSVLYVSTAANIVAGQVDGNGPTSRDLFLFDRSSQTSTLVSHAASDPLTGGDHDTGPGKFSADGQWVVFTSSATNLIDNQSDNNSSTDIFLYNVFSGDITLISHIPGTAEQTGNGRSFNPAINYDGRFVVYATNATDLVDGETDTNNASDVVLYDRLSDTTTLVSRSAADALLAGDGSSDVPAINDTGRYIAYVSASQNLVTGQVDTGGTADVFLFDTQAVGDATTLLSGAAGSATAAGFGSAPTTFAPQISSDGSHVAFVSTAMDLIAGQTDTNGTSDVFIYDTQATGTKLTLVSHAASSASSAVGGDRPSMSANGQFVAYQSDATNLVTGQVDVANTRDVFLYTVSSGTSVLVSHNAGNAKVAGNTSAGNPIMNSGNSFVVFSGSSSDLVTGQVDTNATSDVFRFDRQTGQTVLVSSIPGTEVGTGNGPSGVDGVSEDGTIVVFEGFATNLVTGDQNRLSDTFVWDQNGEPPGFAISGNGVEIVDRDISPSPIDSTDFGSVPVIGSSVTRTFTITNNGGSPLHLTGSPKVVVVGGSSSGFTVVEQPEGTVFPQGGSTTFQVQFDPTKPGLSKATLQIAGDDGPPLPYTFDIQGTGVAPLLTLIGGTRPVTIPFNSTVPSATNGTDFGSTVLGNSVTHTFTIRNDGNQTLNIRGTPEISISGPASPDYTVELSNDGVQPGGSVTLNVTFTPHGGGTRSAVLTIHSNAGTNSDFTFTVSGTGVGVGFAKSIGGVGIDGAQAVAVDPSGNIYIAGAMSNSVSFPGGTLTSAGAVDILIAKYDPIGNFLWADRIGGTMDDQANAIALDADGNVLVGGFFQGTADFNPGGGVLNLTSAGGMDGFILKLEPKSGGFIWARAVGGIGNDMVNGVATGPSGAVLAVGSFQSSGDFNPGSNVFTLTSNGGTDAFALQLDKNGNHVWSRSMGSTGDDSANGVAVDSSGNAYISGAVAGTADFDPLAGVANRSTNNGTQDAFLWKLNTTGSLVWANVFGGDSGADVGRGVSISGNHVVVTGLLHGSGDFDPDGGVTILSAPIDSAFVAAYQIADGDLVWAHAFSGAGTVNGRGIATTPDGGVLIMGDYYDTTDMDPSDAGQALLAASGLSDVYITKLDKDGHFVFTRGLSYNTQSVSRGVASDALGRPVAVGVFLGTAAYDTGDGTYANSSAGNTDGFIWKFLPPPVTTLTGAGHDISDGATLTHDYDGTAFGSIQQGAPNAVHTFTVSNPGLSPLHLTNLQLPTGFVLVDPLSEWLNPGQSDTFSIALSGAKAGRYAGNVSFVTNNPTQSPYVFAVSGTVISTIAVTLSEIAQALDLPASATAGMSVTGSPAAITKAHDNTVKGVFGFPTGPNSDFLVLSTGVAAQFDAPGSAGFTGTDLGTPGLADDSPAIHFSLPVANAAQGQMFRFDYMFLTQNYPAVKNAGHNDQLSVLVDFDGSGGADPINMTLDLDHNLASVDGASFVTNSPLGAFNARTQPLTASILVPATASSLDITIRLDEGGDAQYDSAAFLDNFRFQATQTVYLNFNGHSNLNFNGATADVPAFSVTDVGFNATISAASVESVILTEVQNSFSGYNIHFVTTQPSSGPYMEVVIGGDGRESFFDSTTYGRLFGQADDVNYLNTVVNDRIIINSKNFAASYPAASDVSYRTNNPNIITQILSVTVAHEVGHNLGLYHLDNVNDTDVMKQNAPMRFVATFHDADLVLAGHPGMTENTADYLAQVLGLTASPDEPGILDIGKFGTKLEQANFSIALPIYNVTLGTIADDSEGDISPQIFTFPVLTSTTALSLPNITGTDKFFLIGSSKPNGPMDVTTGGLNAQGLPDIYSAAVDLTDDQGALLDSVNLFKVAKGKLSPFTTAGVAANPYSAAIKYLPGGKGTFTDADGDTYTITLTGGGTVGMSMNDPDNDSKGSIDSIVLLNTTAKSQLSISVKKGAAGDGIVTIGSITGGTLKSLSASASDIVGAGINFTGLVGTLTVRDLLNSADIAIGGGSKSKTTLTARKLGDGSAIHTSATIAALTAVTVGNVDITAPVLSKLTTKADAKTPGGTGSFAGNVTLTGTTGVPLTLGTATIAGALTGTWNVTGGGTSITAASAANVVISLSGTLATGLTINGDASNLAFNSAGTRNLTVKGALTNSHFATSGSISAVAVGSITGSTVFAGVAPGVTALPATFDQFANPAATIGSFSITSSPPAGTSTFQNSQVAAAIINKIALKEISPNNNGTDVGFTAATVGSYTRTSVAVQKNLTVGEHDRQIDFVVKVLATT